MAGDTVQHRDGHGEPQTSTPAALQLPSLRQIAGRAIPQILDGAVLPLAIFLLVNGIAGIWFAMVAGLGWSGVAIVRRVRRSRRVPAMIVVGTVTLAVRSTLVVTTGSAFLYFLQPTVGTAVIAVGFLASVAMRRPLSRRFAGDFLSLPRDLLREGRVHTFFMQNSLMWAAVGLLNASIAYALLISVTPATFAAVQTTIFLAVTIVAVGVSVLWFRRSIGRYRAITVGI
jgi:intracellular septation protein A